MSEKLFNNAPWWMVSAGAHVVLVLGAALIYVEKVIALEEVTIRGDIRHTPTSPTPPPTTDRGIEDKRSFPSDVGDPTPVEDEPLFNPAAKDGKKNQSADQEPYGELKGKSKDFLTRTPGEGGGIGRDGSKTPGKTDVLGPGFGGGGGGSKGGDKGGWEDIAVKRRIKGTVTESAVRAALEWLAKHQDVDGRWSAATFGAKCGCPGAGDADFDTGETGLAVLAFLGAGYTQVSKDPVPGMSGVTYGQVVKNGLKWLTAQQDLEGCVGPRGSKYMYNHTIAALALCEAYGMTGSANLKSPAQQSIDFLCMAQNPGKGWRYSMKAGDNDSSVTGWAVMALKSAELSDIAFPRTAFDGAMAWLDEATEKGGYYRTGYTSAGTGKVFVPNVNEGFDHHESMSAVAVLSRIFIQKNRKDPALGASTLLLNDLPAWQGSKIDFYYWYYASLALFQLDGPNGPRWKRWNEPMKNAIVPHQKTGKDGCRNGSWDPELDRWGAEGGRVYATAINCLTLEVYYRYANVFGGTAR